MTRLKQRLVRGPRARLVRWTLRETGLSHRFRWIIGPPLSAVNGVLRRYFASGPWPAGR
jgi:hypothetical protein